MNIKLPLSYEVSFLIHLIKIKKKKYKKNIYLPK